MKFGVTCFSLIVIVSFSYEKPSFAKSLRHSHDLEVLTRLVQDASNRNLVKARTLAKLIQTECQKYQLDPVLVMAVIKIESDFQYRAVSSAGALGLMQVMPMTGREVASQMKLKKHVDRHLFNPVTNIRLGVKYLAHLKQRFGHNQMLYLSAYNWGPTRIRNLSQTKALSWDHLGYAKKVLSVYDHLKRRQKVWVAKLSPKLQAMQQ